MAKKTTISDKKSPRGTTSFSIQKDGADRFAYYVTRSENGKVTDDRTLILVPEDNNLFFKKGKAGSAA